MGLIKFIKNADENYRKTWHVSTHPGPIPALGVALLMSGAMAINLYGAVKDYYFNGSNDQQIKTTNDQEIEESKKIRLDNYINQNK